ncbi:urease accessory protein UreF [Scytonema hofmannii PCC 7110]|uniref:Urease accessory protein UreF n=1 Tax=Scytonema hofmannii PCC 7110 TaxID=128403 RepID=A0A139X9L6_9CYAN|nr:urease accessory protein UreF [Scytonema hofmannii]KYC41366.1 urease accessory protein UreF [Scytonema hofmannii PCC 7110]
MDTIMLAENHLLCLLQLASPALPVGAYSYSEGLETLVENGTIKDRVTLQHWLEAELRYGAIRLEGAVMMRAYQSVKISDLKGLSYWNSWLSAARETEELRASSWQMGRSLIRLLVELLPQMVSITDAVGNPCNYAVAFGIAAAHWNIEVRAALLAYLHSWASNLITGGVKLLPLGQTAGQQVLLSLQELLVVAVEEIVELEDDNLSCCSWGLSLASMAHETQYTRLFRS